MRKLAGLLLVCCALSLSMGVRCGPPPTVETRSNLAALAGEELTFEFEVPFGATGLSFSLYNMDGDADLYIAQWRPASESDYDCMSSNPGTEFEYCAGAQFPNGFNGGTYFVTIAAVTDFNGGLLRLQYHPPPPIPRVAPTNVSAEIVGSMVGLEWDHPLDWESWTPEVIRFDVWRSLTDSFDDAEKIGDILYGSGEYVPGYDRCGTPFSGEPSRIGCEFLDRNTPDTASTVYYWVEAVYSDAAPRSEPASLPFFITRPTDISIEGVVDAGALVGLSASFTDNSSYETGYHVYLSGRRLGDESNRDDVLIATLDPVAGVNTTYAFTYDASDFYWDESYLAKFVPLNPDGSEGGEQWHTFRTPALATGPIQAPANFTIVTNDAYRSEWHLSWYKTSHNIHGYVIEYSEDPAGPFEQIGLNSSAAPLYTSGENVKTFRYAAWDTDALLDRAKSYTFRVRSYNLDGFSAPAVFTTQPF